MTELLFILFCIFLYKKSRTPYYMEYRPEFTSLPSRSKTMVWALRRRNGLFSSETIQIDSDKNVIRSALIQELTSCYSLYSRSDSFLFRSKLFLIKHHTGIVL